MTEASDPEAGFLEQLGQRVRTMRALHGEASERAKAEANANLAIEALDRTFERLYPTRISAQPQPGIEGWRGEVIAAPNAPILSKETAALLEEMLPFYDRLAQRIGNGDDLRFRTAEANRRVGAIRQRLGQLEDAVKAYQRAIALFQELASRSSSNSNLPLKMAQIQIELGRLFTGRRETSEARKAHLADFGPACSRGGGGLRSARHALRVGPHLLLPRLARTAAAGDGPTGPNPSSTRS